MERGLFSIGGLLVSGIVIFWDLEPGIADLKFSTKTWGRNDWNKLLGSLHLA